ncbi:calcium release-activated calcium channel protein 1-like [Prorops nasuta]|uniref:calcium release-activated calcium channel protein 1-like n=1 Tax=Prorops nasuta TaxID=863751 RepID=UPI0034CD3652
MSYDCGKSSSSSVQRYSTNASTTDLLQSDRTLEKHGGEGNSNPSYSNSDENVGKCTKSTQSDISHCTWRPQYSAQRSRPNSATFLPRHTQPNEASYFGYHPKHVLYPSQSELVLSPRHKYSKHVTLDMKSISGPPYPVLNHVPLSNAVCTCHCACPGPHASSAPASHHSDEQDGPQGLSWRRLHMSRAKLKATATTSELLSGFAMVAMVELQINEPTAVPEWLFVMFAVCTTVLVSVHIFALMISTYLLPNVEAISKLQVSRLISESPHERMRGFIELAWAFSTVLGLFLFLVEVAILCWVKFWDYSFTAATASTVIVIPVLIVFVAFAVHFYHSLVVYKCEASLSDMKELEDIKKNLDNVSMGQTTV